MDVPLSSGLVTSFKVSEGDRLRLMPRSVESGRMDGDEFEMAIHRSVVYHSLISGGSTRTLLARTNINMRLGPAASSSSSSDARRDDWNTLTYLSLEVQDSECLCQLRLATQSTWPRV